MFRILTVFRAIETCIKSRSSVTKRRSKPHLNRAEVPRVPLDRLDHLQYCLSKVLDYGGLRIPVDYCSWTPWYDNGEGGEGGEDGEDGEDGEVGEVGEGGEGGEGGEEGEVGEGGEDGEGGDYVDGCGCDLQGELVDDIPPPGELEAGDPRHLGAGGGQGGGSFQG